MIDAHLVVVAVRRAGPILTGDVHDFESLISGLPERRPKVVGWGDV